MKKVLLSILLIVLVFSMTTTVFADRMVVEVMGWDTPVQLAEGNTLGQTFKAEAKFNYIVAFLPTWHKTTSCYTFTLRKDSPDGAVIFTQDVTNAEDGRTDFTVGSQPAGTYYMEISNPKISEIGWWSVAAGNVYPDGTAYANGQPVEGSDRCFTVEWKGPEEEPAAAVEKPAEEPAPAAEAKNPKTSDVGVMLYAMLALTSAGTLIGNKKLRK